MYAPIACIARLSAAACARGQATCHMLKWHRIASHRPRLIGGCGPLSFAAASAKSFSAFSLLLPEVFFNAASAFKSSKLLESCIAASSSSPSTFSASRSFAATAAASSSLYKLSLSWFRLEAANASSSESSSNSSASSMTVSFIITSSSKCGHR